MGGASVDIETNILYVSSTKACSAPMLVPGLAADKDDPNPIGRTVMKWVAGPGGVRGPQGLPLFKPPPPFFRACVSAHGSGRTAIEILRVSLAPRVKPVAVGRICSRNRVSVPGPLRNTGRGECEVSLGREVGDVDIAVLVRPHRVHEARGKLPPRRVGGEDHYRAVGHWPALCVNDGTQKPGCAVRHHDSEPIGRPAGGKMHRLVGDVPTVEQD